MKFLVPVGGVTDPAFGILTTYYHHGVVAGIQAGLPWAADNCAFSNSFDGDRFLAWLPTMNEYADTCLFVLYLMLWEIAKQRLNAFGTDGNHKSEGLGAGFRLSGWTIDAADSRRL